MSIPRNLQSPDGSISQDSSPEANSKKRKSQIFQGSNSKAKKNQTDLANRLSNIYGMYMPMDMDKYTKRRKCNTKPKYKPLTLSSEKQFSDFYFRERVSTNNMSPKNEAPSLPPIPAPGYSLAKTLGSNARPPKLINPNEHKINRQHSANLECREEIEDGHSANIRGRNSPMSNRENNHNHNHNHNKKEKAAHSYSVSRGSKENYDSFRDSTPKVVRGGGVQGRGNVLSEPRAHNNTHDNIIVENIHTDTGHTPLHPDPQDIEYCDDSFEGEVEVDGDGDLEEDPDSDGDPNIDFEPKPPRVPKGIQKKTGKGNLINSSATPPVPIYHKMQSNPMPTVPQRAKLEFQELMVISEEQERIKAEKDRLRREFEKRNLEHLKKLSQKKKEELSLLEEERRKMLLNRDKIKNMVLKRAAKMRNKGEGDEEGILNNINNINNTTTPKRTTQENISIEEGDKQPDPEVRVIEQAKLRKFFRSRYATLLTTLKENVKSKQLEEEKVRVRQEKIKNKLKEDLGVLKVESKFRQDNTNNNNINITEISPKKNIKQPPIKKPIVPKPIKLTVEKVPEKINNTNSLPISAPTSFVANNVINAKKVTKELSKEEWEEKERLDREKKKQRKDAADQLMRRQQKYIQDLQIKKERDAAIELEKKEKEKKRQQIIREAARQIGEEVKSRDPIGYQERKERKQPEKDMIKKEKLMSKEEFAELLKRHKPKTNLNAFVITDLTTWKKRHKVDENAKVFIISGGYPDFRRALKERDWVENKDQTSCCFDLKWCLKARDIDHSSLLDFQIVNHFPKNTEITTKIGLTHNLKNLIWYNNVDIDLFYPRCYDLNDNSEFNDFISDFKIQKAENILKIFKRRGNVECVGGELRLMVALRVCERNCKDLDEILESSNPEMNLEISPEEWEILGNDELDAQQLAAKKHAAWFAKITNAGKKKGKKKGKGKRKSSLVEKEEPEEEVLAAQEGKESDSLLAKVDGVLEQLESKFPQFALNGSLNMWIVKPAGMSRGRGIHVFNDLTEIIDYVRTKDSQWVAQKYIENPMIIMNRKFDIRQWVLVTSWNPLIIWFYNDPYVRFGAEDYSVDAKKLNNKLIHLTNNSVTKYGKQDCVGTGNMWDSETFAEHLEEKYGSDVFEEQLMPKMKKIVIWSLESVQESVVNSSTSCEMYGYDFMVDSDLNPWLIEVNSSPAMDYSTGVTTKLVKAVGEDTVKVIVDYHFASKKKKPKIETGNWELIHHSKKCEKPLNAFGLNLMCEGKKITKLHMI